MSGDSRALPDWQAMLQAADFARAMTERDEAHRREMRRLLLDFLEVLDSLDRLLAPGEAVAGPSLAVLRRQLLEAFGRAGVRFFESTSRPFDPERHEAVESRWHPGLAAGTVVEEIRPGCEWNGELLRTAQAVVAREP